MAVPVLGGSVVVAVPVLDAAAPGSGFGAMPPLRAHAIIVCELNRSLFERPLAFTAGFFALRTAPAAPVSIPPKSLLARTRYIKKDIGNRSIRHRRARTSALF